MISASLGNVQFDILTGPTAIDITSAAEFAEHKLIEGKPRLQFLGEGLNAINLQISLRSQFCNPEEKLRELRNAKTAHTALPLIFGTGLYKGRYVITDLGETISQTTASGELLSLEVRLTLKEWVDINPLAIKKQQQINRAPARKKPGKKKTVKAKKVKTKPTLLTKTKATYGTVDISKVSYEAIVRQELPWLMKSPSI